MHSKAVPRRRHGSELKAQVLAECDRPEASVAAVAQAHDLNANLVHKWRRGTEAAPAKQSAAFIELPMPHVESLAPTPDIRMELRRGQTAVSI